MSKAEPVQSSHNTPEDFLQTETEQTEQKLMSLHSFLECSLPMAHENNAVTAPYPSSQTKRKHKANRKSGWIPRKKRHISYATSAVLTHNEAESVPVSSTISTEDKNSDPLKHHNDDEWVLV